MGLFTGILLHGLGALSASLCYTPQKGVSGWSWQTYWLVQAAICWLILPFVVAYFTIPSLGKVLSAAPADAMWRSFLLGAVYGIGGTAFGIAIRYVGFSLTYAISVGISCVLGTLLPPLYKGEFRIVVAQDGFVWILVGILIGVLGITLCGMAGYAKDRDLAQGRQESDSFNIAKGLPVCLLAGVLAAFFSFALDQGRPIAVIAEQYGAGDFQGNVIYIFSNTGAFVTTAIYCIYLHVKNRTFKEFIMLPNIHRTRKPIILSLNYAFAGLTGILWYTQFFFYGLGHTRMGKFEFSSWAIHMILLVLCSSVIGLLLKEWKSTSTKTRNLLLGAVSVLIIAVLVLTYGNSLGKN